MELIAPYPYSDYRFSCTLPSEDCMTRGIKKWPDTKKKKDPEECDLLH
jgi:hypothetical protein